MRKTNTVKTPSSDFNVTTPETSLLSQQTVTSKGILVLYTNLQLNPYPNTQLDLFCNDNLSFPIRDQPIDARILVCDLITNLRRMLAAKFFSSSHDEEHKAPLVTKP